MTKKKKEEVVEDEVVEVLETPENNWQDDLTDEQRQALLEEMMADPAKNDTSGPLK